MRNTLCVVCVPYVRTAFGCPQLLGMQLTHKATVRGAAPEGNGNIAVVGVLRRRSLPTKATAATALPARSGTNDTPGGDGLLKAPTPSAASNEWKKTVSAGPVDPRGLHVCEAETNVVVDGHVEHAGEPAKA